MTKQDIIDAAMQIATGMGVDGHDSPVVDSEMTAEDLLPIVHRYVYTELLKNEPMRFQDLVESHPIEVTDGQGLLPENIMTEYMHLSFLPDYPYSSLAMFPDYSRQRFDNLLCYWTYNNGQFYTTCTGAVTSGSGTEGSTEGSGGESETIILDAVTIPPLPPDMDTEVDFADRDLQSIIMALALAVRGELKFDHV